MADATTLHHQMFEAVDRRDFIGLRSLYHPDYIYTGADGVEQKGPDAGVAVAESYTRAFPDLRLEARVWWTPGAQVSICEFLASGTHQAELEGIPATGRRVELTVCNVIETVDDLVYREREYYDALSLMRQ